MQLFFAGRMMSAYPIRMYAGKSIQALFTWAERAFLYGKMALSLREEKAEGTVRGKGEAVLRQSVKEQNNIQKYR